MENNILKLMTDKMDNVINNLKQHIATIRTGRATPALLHGVNVEYYGTPTPVEQICAISSPEPRMLMIKPYEKTMTKQIIAAINASDLGLNCNDQGDIIRINIPLLTEEKRKLIIKQMLKEVENYKVTIRNERRDALHKIKKDKEMSINEVKILENDVQDLTNKFIKEIEQLARQKEKELLKI
ncbi:ribosome recycling factor [Spiroplasma endosymbiont of Amphibalanus improvisus]|uniref:ribosome recycling factor n=1 Tax=Spiroplasma endosymbiont of Amphibalanus improvisus TaxID=3066327 RepID=UPI00313DE32C